MSTPSAAADGGKEEATITAPPSPLGRLDLSFAALLVDGEQLASATAALQELACAAGGVTLPTSPPLTPARRRQAVAALSSLLQQAVDAAAAENASATPSRGEDSQQQRGGDSSSGSAAAAIISATSSAAADLVSTCIRAVGNLCIEDDDERSLFLSHGALASLLLCLRRYPQLEVHKVAVAALANLVCGHEQAQEAFTEQQPTPVITALLNRTINRVREGAGTDDDYVLCRLILRLYINVAAYTHLSPLPVVLHRHRQLLSSQLIPSCIALARLFVIPISDQPEPDDHALLVELLTLFTAFQPSLIDTASHSQLISLVIDIAKRSSPALHALAFPLLASWWHAHPERILAFLSSRLHSSKPALQLPALTALLSVLSDAEDTSVVEAVLKALPLVAGLLASKVEEVATTALSLLEQLVRHQEVREEVWEAKGLRQGLWKAVQQGRGVKVMAVLSVLALSVSLHAKMEAEGVVEKVVDCMMHLGQGASAAGELRGGWRVLHHLLAVLVERDGGDDELDNRRWEWKELQAREPDAVPASLLATHRSVACRLLKSPSFLALLSSSPIDSNDAALLDRAVVLADVLAAHSEADEALTSSPAVEPLLVALSHSELFAHQHAAAQAWRALLLSSPTCGSGVKPTSPQLQLSVLQLLDSGSSLVAADAVTCVELLQLSRDEVQRVQGVTRRWEAGAAAASALHADERMESEALVLLLHQRLQRVAASGSSQAMT